MNKIKSSTEQWIEKGTSFAIKIAESGSPQDLNYPTPPLTLFLRLKSLPSTPRKLWWCCARKKMSSILTLSKTTQLAMRTVRN